MIDHGDNWTHPDELAALREWSRNAKLAVEIGTWTGRSAEAILQGMDDGQTNGVLICVDHFMGAPEGHQYGRWVETPEGRESIKATWRERLAKWNPRLPHESHPSPCHLWEMDTARAAKLMVQLKMPPRDFIFIDGDHLYEGVRRDLECWWPLVAPGGIFCGHDFNCDGVEAAVTEFFADGVRRGTVRLKTGPRDLWRVDKPLA